jgi:DNA-directed RNA polymerase specialized sigma24 family protein
MEDPESLHDLVQRAAARGARSVTTTRQLIADAVQVTLERLEDKALCGAVAGDWAAWAFRVAANAAKRLAMGQSRWRSEPLGSLKDQQADSAGPLEDTGSDRGERPSLEVLLSSVDVRTVRRRGRMLEVVEKMACPGMSFRRAARDLGMSPSNVARSFRSALRLLEERKTRRK